MIKMLLIAPFQKMADDFKIVFEHHNRTSLKAEYEVEKYSLETIIARVPDELPSFDFNVEVVISRGLVSSGLRKLNVYIPVVELPVAANDIIKALHKARMLNNEGPVAVTGSPNMIMGAQDIADILGVSINTYIIPTDDDIESVARKAFTDGARTLIGGIHTTTTARNLGMQAILLESGRESIWHSITEAKRLAFLMRREEEKTARLNTILNHSDDAVVVLDPRNKIQLFNKAAERIFGRPSNSTIGLPISQIFPAYMNLESIPENVNQGAEVTQHNGLTLNITESPLKVHNENIGKLLTVQDISRIQALESKIREKLYQRGHIARHRFEDIKGISEAIQEKIRIAREYSQTDSTIMIVGQTGTGKELFAQSIHNESRRYTGPFIALNCAALPEHLLESELFGYVEGTFTGAAKGGKPGLFEIAHQGTIFLDEISEIPLKLQAKLLRVLQEKEVRRIGHDKIIPLDVRIITATNKNLFTMVEQGLFREDLFYRLNILELSLPGLCDRREDIPILIQYIFDRLSKPHPYTIQISTEAINYLKFLEWPGNIRQLRNICERFSVLYKMHPIELSDAQRVIANSTSICKQDSLPKEIPIIDPRIELEKAHENYDRQVIVDTLKKADFNKGKAAACLGISRATLWRKMKKLGLT